MPRALLIKLGAIGDVVMAVPAAHALHQAGFEIDWVCGLQVAPLLARYSWIRTFAVDDRALFQGSSVDRLRAVAAVWGTFGGRHYELCATLYYDARYRLLALPVRAARKLVLSHTDRSQRLLPGRHHTDEYLRVMLGKDDGPVPVGLAPVPPESLPPSPLRRTEGKDRVVLVPGGARNAIRSDGLRRWPVESYVAVARDLLGRGAEIVLVGGPEDVWAAEEFRGIDVQNQIGQISLVETLALMDAGDVVVTHDTGPLHLAGVTSAGIVSIFGPTDPWARLPQRRGAVALWGGEGFACRPCYDSTTYASCRNNACVQQIMPEMVVREVTDLMRQRRSGSMQPPRVITPASTVTIDPRSASRPA